MNHTAINPGPVGTTGLKWTTDPIRNGRYVVLGEGQKTQLVAGLDATKAYAVRSLSDHGGEIRVNALGTPSRVVEEQGTFKTVTILDDVNHLGYMINAGSFYATAASFTAGAAGPVAAKFGANAKIVLHIYEVGPSKVGATPWLDGTPS